MMEITNLRDLEIQWEGIQFAFRHKALWASIIQQAQSKQPSTVFIHPNEILREMTLSLNDIKESGQRCEERLCAIQSLDDIGTELYAESKYHITYVDNMPCIEGIPIWERIEGEAAYYFEAFKTYRDMKSTADTRNLYAVAGQLGVKYRMIDIVQKAWNWRIRVQAYDSYQQYVAELRKNQSMINMNNRHMDTAKSLFVKAANLLSQKLEDMEGKDLINLMEKLVHIERVAHGIPKDKPTEEQVTNNTYLVTPQSAQQANTINAVVEITPDNRKQTMEKLASVLTVLQNVNGLKGIVDVSSDDLIDGDLDLEVVE